jgi:mRNA interferase RelE/StbE
MALYKIEFKVTFQKDIRMIPRIDRKKIFQRIDSLAINPRPRGCKKLAGQDKYRIRQGDYRIIYTIIDNELTVWVVKVGHRKDIYRVSEEKEKFTADNPKTKNSRASYP